MTPTGMPGQRRDRSRGHNPLADAVSLPVTGESHPLRRDASRRLVFSCVLTLALGVLVTGAWLVRGNIDEAERQGTRRRLPERVFRPGLRGPVTVLGELSVRSGDDAVTRDGRPALSGPTAPPRPRPAAGAPKKAPAEPPVGANPVPVPTPVKGPETGPEAAASGAGATTLATGSTGQVEMAAPAQISPCFVLKEIVRPQYPVDADANARRLAAVTVEAAFFVDVDGKVTASYILRSEGGLPFEQAVLAAVDQWRFEPVTGPECEPLGFWVRLPVTFRNPDARVGRGATAGRR